MILVHLSCEIIGYNQSYSSYTNIIKWLTCSSKEEKKKQGDGLYYYIMHSSLELVWYMCLKTKNYCLKIFVEIRVGEKMCENA